MSQYPKMVAHGTDRSFMTLTPWLLLLVTCETCAFSKHLHETLDLTIHSNVSACHDGFMSVYIPKKEFTNLPFTIYVRDEHGGCYQAIAVEKQCQYLLRETEALIILTVASNGCFVRKQKYTTNLTVVILEYAKEGRLEIVKTITVTCERKPEEEKNKAEYPLLSTNLLLCDKDGFNISIPMNVTNPPLNLNIVPFSQGANCQPQKTADEAVKFSFPFTDCGTQSMKRNGIITYWVNLEVKQNPKKGSIFHYTPFNLTLHCSFVLVHSTLFGIHVQAEPSENPSTIRSKGTLKTKMRFSKDSNYRSFYSSRDPLVTELGLPVYVEVFVPKHEDKDSVLVLEDCWATSTKNPFDPLRWNLLVEGCPFHGDTHKTVVLPVVPSREIKSPSLHKWFVVKMFSFVKPQKLQSLNPPLQIHFHCNVEICKGPNCSQLCRNGQERKSRHITPWSGLGDFSDVVSGGPFLYLL